MNLVVSKDSIRNKQTSLRFVNNKRSIINSIVLMNETKNKPKTRKKNDKVHWPVNDFSTNICVIFLY